MQWLTQYCIENNERFLENSGILSEELSSQMTRKLEEITTSLNSHILQANDAAISEKVIPQLQLSLGVLGYGSNEKMD